MPTIPLGLVGPSTHTNTAHQNSRTVNLYPEAGEAGAKAPFALFQTPGLIEYADLADDVPTAGQIRGLHVMNGRLFAVAGNTILEHASGSFVNWGTIGTSTGPVKLSDNNGVLVLGDGEAFWTLNTTTSTLAQVLNEGEEVIAGWFSCYLAGRTYYLEKDSDRFHWSALGDPATVEGLDFATAEGNPDPAVAMFCVNQEVGFLGTASTENWGLSGDVTAPIVRISGGYRELGCAARFAALKFADTICFIGQDASGHAQVYLGGSAGRDAQPISNHSVERDVNSALLLYDRDDIRAFEYTEPGHKFYVLVLPNAVTWAFDLTTKMWCERGEIDLSTGLWTRIRQDVHAFLNGVHWVAGRDSARLYSQSRNYHDLVGDPLVRLRETPTISAQGRRIRFSSVTVDMSVGIGKDGVGQGVDPQLMMQFSDDKGRTWSGEIWRKIGRIGETKTQVKFGPCGMSRERVFRFRVSDPCAIVFVEAYADVEFL
jgi:hypothetical protein